MAPVDFSGVWKIHNTTNNEAYLEEIGCGWMAAKMASMPPLVLTVTQTGDDILITGTNMKGKSEEKFTVGTEFEQPMPPSGMQCKCTTKWEGNKLIFDVQPHDEKFKPQHIVRELIDGDMILTINIGNVVCVRHFKPHVE